MVGGCCEVMSIEPIEPRLSCLVDVAMLVSNSQYRTYFHGLKLLNKILMFIRFLQMFTAQDVVSVTKMDASNLSMVFAPNFMRCPSKVRWTKLSWETQKLLV